MEVEKEWSEREWPTYICRGCELVTEHLGEIEDEFHVCDSCATAIHEEVNIQYDVGDINDLTKDQLHKLIEGMKSRGEFLI